MTLDCVAGEIAFNRKISSEPIHDRVRFFIDGTIQDWWYGLEDWTPVSYPVSAGTRTFKWEYMKDWSDSHYEDAGWIDDIVFPVDCGGDCCAQTVTSLPYCEGFEGGLGQWVDDTADDMNWTRGSGQTPTILTGPFSAHSGEYYLYTQAVNNHDKTARLDLCFDLTESRHPELNFWYHMYGTDMGTLSVGVADRSCTGWTTVWTESGDQGTLWREATVELSRFRGRRVMISFAGRTGAGPWSDMAIDDICVSEGPPCPPGQVTFLDPPHGVVDARQPHPPEDPTIRQGIDSFLVQAPPGADNLRCWERCETSADGPANSITGVADSGNGTFTVNLARTISTGAVTTVTYTDDDGVAHTGVFTSHPASVDGEGTSGTLDVLRLIDCLTGEAAPPCGIYSADVDRSGLVAPADILRTIDLLNGAEEFDSWNGSPRPDCGSCCP